MNGYSFIHHGAKVLWEDPCAAYYGQEEARRIFNETVYVVYSINGDTHGKAASPDDTVVIYNKFTGENHEVAASQLVKHEEPQEKKIRRWVREADTFLVSCLRYADERMKKAEAEAADAKDELRKVLDRRKGDRALFVQEQVYKEQKQTIASLEKEVCDLRRRLDYYMAGYLSVRKPAAQRLQDLTTAFDDTPDAIAARLLDATLPQSRQRVVIVDCEGRIYRPVGIMSSAELVTIAIEPSTGTE